MMPAAPISSAFLIGTSSPDARRMTHGVGLGGLQQRLHLRGVQRRVLGVDEEPVESRVGHQFGDGGGVEGHQRGEERLAGSKPRPE